MADPLVEAIKARFDDFLERYYREKIDSIIISYPQKRSLMVDFKDLSKFDPELAQELADKPDLVIEAANESLADKLSDVATTSNEPHVRFFGQNINTPLVMDVGSSYIGKMMMMDSLVVKRSEINPKAKIDAYKCSYCGAVYKFRAGKDETLDICTQCKRKSLKQVPEESSFVNLQRIAVQDPLEKLKGNSPTWQLEVWLEDDLVNTVIPGDIIELTGILRIRPRRNQRGKLEKSVYTMFLETISVVPKQKEFAELTISEDEERQILEIAKDPKIFERISKSIATSIYGYDEIKQAVALQLFGGTQGKLLVDGGQIRADMHILLIGDPGSAKTRILQTVAHIVPKGIYVSGKSVTGGGLTAIAERDEFAEGGWVLKAGALVLANGGILAADEFDKVGEDDRASMHEALESQTISVAKAGIIATFNARTAVLAAANPKFGRFDPHQYPVQQFDIPPTLLSRFDLIFPIKDIMDPEQDTKIAQHILMQHEAAGAKISDIKNVAQVEEPPINVELLRKYIAYAKKNVTPRLTDPASKRIQEYYVELRKLGLKQGATPITPRQIEGLVRMAEASAKARLSSTVEVADAERAIALTEFMLKTLAVDSTNRVDIDTILTGMPREKVDKINNMISIIRKLEEASSGKGAVYSQVIEEAVRAGMTEVEAKKQIEELEKIGDVFTPRSGVIKLAERGGD
ncbi:MAG: minichromosome maintenance protein MCM [Candidatus Micrarchaeales archaeon]|nr:minichromosome maintenance protein MCM [Candidatus Micrarchaeales archaeon]